MTTTRVYTIEELVECGILGALAFEFAMLTAELAYSTSSLSELTDSAPAPAKKMAEMFRHVYQTLGTETINSGSASASVTTSPEEP